MLLVLCHHGHPVDGVGDGVLDTGLDVGSHNERSRKSMVFNDVCELWDKLTGVGVRSGDMVS